ncbi:hypothetical protein ABK040_015897 [Willaertia magna]
MLQSAKLFSQSILKKNKECLLPIFTSQTRHLSNFTYRPTKQYEENFVVGKANHARRKPAKKFYKWTPNPKVPKKQIEEHNSKENAPGTKKEQLITERNKELIATMFKAGKEYNPVAAIDAYHKCSHRLDTRVYSVLIKSMEKSPAHIGDAFQIYNDMIRSNKKPNIVTFNHLLNVCIAANHLPRAMSVLKDVYRSFYNNKNQTVVVGEGSKKLANQFFQKLLKLCYDNNDPIKGLKVLTEMRNLGLITLSNNVESEGEIPKALLSSLIFTNSAKDAKDETKQETTTVEGKDEEQLHEFWVGMNKAKRPSFTDKESALLPSTADVGIEGNNKERALYESELRKLKILQQANEERAFKNNMLDFDEYGLSTHDHLELKSLSLNMPFNSVTQGGMDEALTTSYKFFTQEFSHLFYNTIFNTKKLTPLVDEYSAVTLDLAKQYEEKLKSEGKYSQKEIVSEIEAFKAFAEAHSEVNERFIKQDGTIQLTEEYLKTLSEAQDNNWKFIYNVDHELISHIPTVIGASPKESARLLSKPITELSRDLFEAESAEEINAQLDKYKKEMKKASRYVNRKVDWKPVILGVDGRPFYPSEEIISIDRVTTETIDLAKQAYIDSIKDEDVKKQIKDEFYGYIHLIWVDSNGKVVEGISY